MSNITAKAMAPGKAVSYVLAAGDGRCFNVAGQLIRILAQGAGTAGAFGAVVCEATTDRQPIPMHFHERGSGSIDTLTNYTITQKDTAGPFTANIPEDMMEKASLKALNYSSVVEPLGERFHVSPVVHRQLNPTVRFVAGGDIRMPNGGERTTGVAARIAVSKRQSILTVLDQAGAVIFQAPWTTGSDRDSLPIGEWTVLSVTRNPTFNYNPDLFWDANPAHAKARIPAGPNGPVGVVWIDINVEHYGIHGTPEPGKIGHTQSHGCVRLTNWDALTVAALVERSTRVSFLE